MGAALPVAEEAESVPDAVALELPWSSPWEVSLALVSASAARGTAEMPVPFVHDDGVSGSVDVKVISAH